MAEFIESMPECIRDHDGHFFSMSCPSEVFDVIEEMELKLEEMRIYCEEERRNSEKLELLLIERDCEHELERRKLSEEVLHLKRSYFSELEAKLFQDNLERPDWLLGGGMEKDAKIEELLVKNHELNAKLLERDGRVKMLEWRLADAEVTITALTAERTKLAMEADDLALRLEEFEYSLRFGSVAPRRGNLSPVDDEANICARSKKANEAEHGDHRKPMQGLKRAANFSNICALDESVDFKLELDKSSCASGSNSDFFLPGTPSSDNFLISKPYVSREKPSYGKSLTERTSSNVSLTGKPECNDDFVSIGALKSWKPFDLDSGFDSDAFGRSSTVCSSQRSNHSDLCTTDASVALQALPPLWGSKHIFSDSYRKSKENPVLRAFTDHEKVENKSLNDISAKEGFCCAGAIDGVCECMTKPHTLRSCFSDDFSELLSPALKPAAKIERCKGRLNLLEDTSNDPSRDASDCDDTVESAVHLESEVADHDDGMWCFAPESTVAVSTGKVLADGGMKRATHNAHYRVRSGRAKSFDGHRLNPILEQQVQLKRCKSMDSLEAFRKRSYTLRGYPLDASVYESSMKRVESLTLKDVLSHHSSSPACLSAVQNGADVFSNPGDSFLPSAEQNASFSPIKRRNSYHSRDSELGECDHVRFSRNKSDPHYGHRSKRKGHANLMAYSEWIKEGKRGQPPVTVTEC